MNGVMWPRWVRPLICLPHVNLVTSICMYTLEFPVPGNIHTPPCGRSLNIQGGGDSGFKSQNFKEGMKLNWNFQRGAGESSNLEEYGYFIEQLTDEAFA